MKLSPVTFFALALFFGQANGRFLRRTLQQCPTPNTDQPCAAEYQPVQCGPDFSCIYPNECTALTAGFFPSQCQPVPLPCPSPGPNSCSAFYNPVACGDQPKHLCYYDNACVAIAAGYTTGCDKMYPQLP